MKNHRIIEALGKPWNMTTSGLNSIVQLVAEHTNADYREGFKDFINQRPEMSIDENGIARIYLQGALAPKLTKIEKACGVTDYGDLKDEVELAQKQAKGILIISDSPGGYCSGNAEAAYKLAESKIPVVTFVEGMACSAAYKIVSSSQRIFATPSSDIGSIGTILPLIDKTGEWQMRGWTPNYITHTGGDLKAAGAPPSTNEAEREYLQQMVDDSFAMFKSHVLNYRLIDESSMRGQAFVASRALENNLIDEIGDEQAAYDYLLKLTK